MNKLSKSITNSIKESKVKKQLSNLSNNNVGNFINKELLYKKQNVKVLDIEDSTNFLMDNSFDEEHKIIMENIENLNPDEIIEPNEKKVNYYTWDYWSSNWYTNTIWHISYLYNYDETNNEIIIKYTKNHHTDEINYVEDLNDEEKKQLVEFIFKS